MDLFTFFHSLKVCIIDQDIRNKLDLIHYTIKKCPDLDQYSLNAEKIPIYVEIRDKKGNKLYDKWLFDMRGLFQYKDIHYVNFNGVNYTLDEYLNDPYRASVLGAF